MRQTSIRRRAAIAVLTVLLVFAFAVQPARAADCWAQYQETIQRYNREWIACRQWVQQVCGPNGDGWTCTMWAWGNGALAQAFGYDPSEGQWWQGAVGFCDVLFALQADAAAFELLSCVAIPVGNGE